MVPTGNEGGISQPGVACNTQARVAAGEIFTMLCCSPTFAAISLPTIFLIFFLVSCLARSISRQLNWNILLFQGAMSKGLNSQVPSAYRWLLFYAASLLHRGVKSYESTSSSSSASLTANNFTKPSHFINFQKLWARNFCILRKARGRVRACKQERGELVDGDECEVPSIFTRKTHSTLFAPKLYDIFTH